MVVTSPNKGVTTDSIILKVSAPMRDFNAVIVSTNAIFFPSIFD